MSKVSLWMIAKRHFETLYDLRTGKRDWVAILIQIGLPVVVVGIAIWRNWRLPDPGLVAGIAATVAALLCAAAVFLFQVRLDLNTHRENIDVDDIVLVDETFYNVLWAVVVGLSVAVTIVLNSSFGTLSRTPYVTGLVIGLGVHFSLVVAMVLRRLQRSYDILGAHRDL